MSRVTGRTWPFLLLLAGWLAVWGSRDTDAAAPQPDHLGSRCASCHLAGNEVTPENARKLTTTQERLCGRCHEGAVEAGHPTGFVPHRPLPAAFPLDWKGEVTCSTCHEVHRDPARPTALRPAAARSGGETCAACHPASFFDRMPDAGASLMRSGHLDARAHRPAQATDPYSARCVACHDDRASVSGGTIRVAFTASNGTGMLNHPIGMPYGRADLQRGLRAPIMLPREVLLPDGKVSCLSCHRGYSETHGALITRRPSQLCLSCHDK